MDEENKIITDADGELGDAELMEIWVSTAEIAALCGTMTGEMLHQQQMAFFDRFFILVSLHVEKVNKALEAINKSVEFGYEEIVIPNAWPMDMEWTNIGLSAVKAG